MCGLCIFPSSPWNLLTWLFTEHRLSDLISSCVSSFSLWAFLAFNRIPGSAPGAETAYCLRLRFDGFACCIQLWNSFISKLRFFSSHLQMSTFSGATYESYPLSAVKSQRPEVRPCESGLSFQVLHSRLLKFSAVPLCLSQAAE